MTHLDFGIIYDDAYANTLRKDERKQRRRRWTHRIGMVYEQTVFWPRWEKQAQEAKSTGKKKTLSTCIMTMNGANRIRPLLEYIRPFSDEIVVGIDSKTTDETWQACDGLADELFIIENNALTCNAGLEELVNRCHGDWVLRLDDDEFPEPRFAQDLQGIVANGRYTHYRLPRIHISNTEPLMWVNDGYLYPDFQMRLFKNDKSLLHFPGAVGHLGIECDGPKGRLNTINLVHLNLAINPRFKREAKLRTYIKRLNGGWVHPVNEHALLFEDFNYRIEPYDYPDAEFCSILRQTTNHQKQAYEQQSLAVSP